MLQSVKTIAILLIVFNQAIGQVFQLNSENSSFAVIGSSTMHEWTMHTKQFDASANIEFNEKELITISSITLTVPVNSLKSGKSLMDRKTYEALNEENYPSIKYELSNIRRIQPMPDGSYAVLADGQLTIAGKTKSILHEISAIVSGEEVMFSGEYSLDMTDYGVEPPTAMLGAIKTGNIVTVKFDLTFSIN